ncbi:MAG: TraR/DksA family transcriptional regulator [Nocardioidaceae bacterium]
MARATTKTSAKPARSRPSATKTPAKKAAAKKPTKAPAKKPSATKAPAKKSPVKKVSAKKAATKATTTTRVPTKKTVKRAPAKKAPAKKASAKSSAVRKAPAKAATKRAAVKKAPTKKAAAKKPPAKKTAAKKAPAKKSGPVKSSPAHRRLAVKANEKPWTAKELAAVRAELGEERARLRSELNLVEVELQDLMRDAGDGAGNDQADVGSTTFERDHEMSLANNAREMLAQIERALGRIEDGSYGRCESCGQPIGKMRVMAFPRATLCLSCKQREERR